MRSFLKHLGTALLVSLLLMIGATGIALPVMLIAITKNWWYLLMYALTIPFTYASTQTLLEYYH